MPVARFIALVGFCLVIYVYIGYPLGLWLLSRFLRREVSREAITPSVTLLISAFNEADVLPEKLRNSLSLNYPPELIEIVVISDASTDDTDCLVQSFANQGVVLLRMPKRGGKMVGLNAAMQVAKGEIIVFSDANILYDPDAIQHLVTNFADSAVGCVTGDSRYLDSDPTAAQVQENTYWKYEQQIRAWESVVGSTVGGDGAIFAIRRELYTPLLPAGVNDFEIPLRIVAQQGYRAVFEPAAIGYEPSSGSFGSEFRRKRRIVSQSWLAILHVPEALNPLKTGLFAWQVWSHKVLRWLVLPFTLAIVVGCAFAASTSWFYLVGWWGFLVSTFLSIIAVFLPDSLGSGVRILKSLFYFYMVNVAATVGITKAIMGRAEAVWTPERS